MKLFILNLQKFPTQKERKTSDSSEDVEHNTNEKEKTSSSADIQMHLNPSSLFMTTRAFLGSKMCS